MSKCTINITPSGHPHSRRGIHILGDAQVYELARVEGNAQVSGNAQLFGQARVLGHAQVSGTALLVGKTIVSQHAQVRGTGTLSGARVMGCVYIEGDEGLCIFGASVYDHARITGSPAINSFVIIKDCAQISGQAQLTGATLVRDQAQVSGEAIVKDCTLRGTVHITGTARIIGGKWSEGTISEGTWLAPGIPQ